MSTFGLTHDQMVILFSLQYYMAKLDANKPEKMLDAINPLVVNHKMKMHWCAKYRKDIDAFIKHDAKEGQESSILSVDALRTFILREESRTENPAWKYMVLLECVLFQPYYPLSEEDGKEKTFKGLTLDEDTRKEALQNISAWLGINQDYADKFLNSYEAAVKKMTGYWKKVFIGVGAGVVAAMLAVVTMGGSVAAMFAASGLYGAAAVSSGLAALGGGAIAAGGFGMAGGMAVLIGGGLILGSGVGANLGMMLASTNPDGVMCECAKMYVVLKEIVIGLQQDTKRIQEIISTVIDQVGSLKKEIAVLKSQIQKDEQRIKNLEKSVEYLEKFVNMAA